jgi:hypothetical protein
MLQEEVGKQLRKTVTDWEERLVGMQTQLKQAKEEDEEFESKRHGLSEDSVMLLHTRTDSLALARSGTPTIRYYAPCQDTLKCNAI